MKRKVSWTIIAVFIILSIFAQGLNGSETTDASKNKMVDTPMCNVRWFLFSEINSSGNVCYAKEKSFACFNSIEMMYYDEGYGTAFVRGLALFGDPHLKKGVNFDRVLSIYAYGFTGNISWDGTVDDTFALANGTALLVRVAYH